MTSAFGGQHSIQLSYGCVRGVEAGRRCLQHGRGGLNPESGRAFLLGAEAPSA